VLYLLIWQPMRNQVWNYLKSAGRPLPAGQILKDVLKIQSPNAIAADRVLERILKDDPRFLNVKNLWQLAEEDTSSVVSKSAALFLRDFPSAAAPIAGGALHLAGSPAGKTFQSSGLMTESDREILVEIRSRLEDRVLVVWRMREVRIWNGLLRSCKLPQWNGESIILGSLAAGGPGAEAWIGRSH